MKKFQKEERGQLAKLKTAQDKEAEALTQILAGKYHIPYVDLHMFPLDIDALKLIPESDARYGGLAVVNRKGRRVQVAVKNPTLSKTKAALAHLKQSGYTAELFLSSLPGLEYVWERYKEIPKEEGTAAGVVEISSQRLKELKEKVVSMGDLSGLVQKEAATVKSARATNILELILTGALHLGASDVHIEAEEKAAMLRMRLDGVLHEIASVPRAAYKLLLSRIKLLSELKLNVRDRAQDGRFTIRAAAVDIEIRTSVLPGPNGESVVLRVLNPKTIGLELEDLGMQQPVYELLRKEIHKPNGMILATGPTGSGKTTTLYAFIKNINSPSIKIITIENPIEYHVEGITQTQVDTSGHYTFEKGLGAILRQDPDIILVGEIRNFQTAETAVHAALTGHLVFSTLHTNDAAGTIPRLIDMGVKPNIFAPAINVAIAQRLVRRLCDECKKGAPANVEERAFINRALRDLPQKYKKPDIKKITLWKVGGCRACNDVGYKGRIGIFEALAIDDAIERMILKNPPEAEIKEAAHKQGMLTMYQDGILKVLDGVTSLEELKRVAGEI